MLEGDNIVLAARRAIMRHDYSAVLTIFPILRHLKQTKADFDTTLQVRLAPWLSLSGHVRETCDLTTLLRLAGVRARLLWLVGLEPVLFRLMPDHRALVRICLFLSSLLPSPSSPVSLSPTVLSMNTI